MIMMPLAYAFHGVGAPLILASHKGLRTTLGLRPWTSMQVAGWVFYALALATLPAYFGFMPPLYRPHVHEGKRSQCDSTSGSETD
jgi:hypothetical protein